RRASARRLSILRVLVALTAELRTLLLEHRRDRLHPERVDQLPQVAPHELGERQHELRQHVHEHRIGGRFLALSSSWQSSPWRFLLLQAPRFSSGRSEPPLKFQQLPGHPPPVAATRCTGSNGALHEDAELV